MMTELPENNNKTGESVFTVRADENNWASYTLPSFGHSSRPVSGRPVSGNIYDAYGEIGTSNDGEYTIVTEIMDDENLDAYQWHNLNGKSGLPTMKAVPIARANPRLSQKAFIRHIRSFENGKIKMLDDGENAISEDEEKEYDMRYENNGPIIMACFVRFLLIAHNVLTVWRVTDDYNENMYWLIVIANFFLILEGIVVIIKRAGIEYEWWTPCFLIYLASTIPAIWLLQLNQYDRFVNADKWTTLPPTEITTIPTTTLTEALVLNVTSNLTSDIADGLAGNDTTTASGLAGNDTSAASGLPSNITTEISTTVSTILTPSEPVFGTFDNDVWVIIIEESLVYLLVFSRWLLPRGKVSRDFLADLLLEFLAIASDIMELLAVFDEDQVRGNLKLTYAILAVWSGSFIQFIPILMQKSKRFRKARNPNVAFLNRHCGDKFVEVVVTCMSIFLQDLPFLVVRLYIIIEVKLITYSLIFFLLKNIVTLMLLFYRLTILCYRLPHCKGKPA
ncbi:transmembrane protein 26-like [Mercenaria mercenaria]|uniref:transmembrane protein 26-like n=1 Tax=Mercenaria mercenaria TaxID=6596 RepID=UPI001E1E1784|nr:transmembrane protein 26-like [Mercenaria mercenaria]